jgi:hypothetical protein
MEESLIAAFFQHFGKIASETHAKMTKKSKFASNINLSSTWDENKERNC